MCRCLPTSVLKKKKVTKTSVTKPFHTTNEAGDKVKIQTKHDTTKTSEMKFLCLYKTQREKGREEGKRDPELQ